MSMCWNWPSLNPYLHTTTTRQLSAEEAGRFSVIPFRKSLAAWASEVGSAWMPGPTAFRFAFWIDFTSEVHEPSDSLFRDEKQI